MKIKMYKVIIGYRTYLLKHGAYSYFLVQADNMQEATTKAYIKAGREYGWALEWWIDDIGEIKK